MNRAQPHQPEHADLPLHGVVGVVVLPAGPGPAPQHHTMSAAVAVNDIHCVIDMPAARAQPRNPGDLAPRTHHPGHPRHGPLRQHTGSIPRHVSAPNGPSLAVTVHESGTGG